MTCTSIPPSEFPAIPATPARTVPAIGSAARRYECRKERLDAASSTVYSAIIRTLRGWNLRTKAAALCRNSVHSASSGNGHRLHHGINIPYLCGSHTASNCQVKLVTCNLRRSKKPDASVLIRRASDTILTNFCIPVFVFPFSTARLILLHYHQTAATYPARHRKSPPSS